MSIYHPQDCHCESLPLSESASVCDGAPLCLPSPTNPLTCLYSGFLAAAASAAVGRELEGVRLELTGAQLRALVAMEDEATGQPGSAGAVMASQAEVERLVAEQARLRLLLSSMSKT